MREVILDNFGTLGVTVTAGVIILIFFAVLSCFRTLFSASFIGLMLSLTSYLVYDYIYMDLPVIACLGFIFCLVGTYKRGFMSTLFSIIGMLLSGYIIITAFGLI